MPTFSVLLALSASHCLNDLLQSVITAVYPMLKADLSLTFRPNRALSRSSIKLAASIFQPVVGYDNYNHLYMYDRATGKPSHQITKGPWYVREIVHVDEPGEKIYFSANGVSKDEDPYFIRYYCCCFNGTGAVGNLTPASDTHRAVFCADFK